MVDAASLSVYSVEHGGAISQININPWTRVPGENCVAELPIELAVRMDHRLLPRGQIKDTGLRRLNSNTINKYFGPMYFLIGAHFSLV